MIEINTIFFRMQGSNRIPDIRWQMVSSTDLVNVVQSEEQSIKTVSSKYNPVNPANLLIRGSNPANPVNLAHPGSNPGSNPGPIRGLFQIFLAAKTLTVIFAILLTAEAEA